MNPGGEKVVERFNADPNHTWLEEDGGFVLATDYEQLQDRLNGLLAAVEDEVEAARADAENKRGYARAFPAIGGGAFAERHNFLAAQQEATASRLAALLEQAREGR
jgi:hypothetical protein